MSLNAMDFGVGRLGEAVRLEAIQDGEVRFDRLSCPHCGGHAPQGCTLLDVQKIPEPIATFLLDFDKVCNPPCSFSEFTTCLLPPKVNVLKRWIESGEKLHE